MEIKKTLLENKRTMRKSVLATRRSCSSKEINNESYKICNLLTQMPIFDQSSNIMLYLAMDDEVNVDIIIDYCFKNSKNVAVPEITDVNGMMKAVLLSDWQEISIGAFGIRSVNVNEKTYMDSEKLDIIIVPAVAYNNYGARLGRGRGFYDRFMSRTLNAVKIGVALSCQMISEIPSEEHDILVDYIITAEGIINCKTGKMC